MRKEHVFIVMFEFKRGRLGAVGHTPMKDRTKAQARAEAIINDYAGVGVYSVWVDEDTFDASDLEEVFALGDVLSLDDMSVAA